MNATPEAAPQGGATPPAPAHPTRKRLQLLTDTELDALPDPTWLMEPLLPAGSLAILFGSPGVGKSFLALDWALSIQRGVPWLARPVKQGSILYIAAEGASGLKKRVRAWKMRHRTIGALGGFFLAEAVQLAKPDQLAVLAQELKQRAPKGLCLIVVDTLSRCCAGADENASKDMSLLVEAVGELQRATGATVLLVHHSPKKTLDTRGSSVLPGAADTIISVERKGNVLTVGCRKQKEAEEFKPFKLTLTSSFGSCVLTDGGPAPVECEVGRHLGPTLEALRAAGADGMTWGEWLRASDKARGTFGNHLKQLLKAELVRLDGKGYHLSEKGRGLVTPTSLDTPTTLS